MKRAFDVVVSALGLAVLWPLFVVIAVMIRLNSPGPVYFRHERVGRGGRLFRMYKFRTMSLDEESRGRPFTVEGDSSITAAGRFLRRFKFDELPQLVDVLLGHMSMVGPRPEVPQYVAQYAEDVRRLVLSVRPGITDLASIRFRDENRILAEAPDPEFEYCHSILPIKLAYAKEYVQRHSFWGDLRILIETLRVLYFSAAARQPEIDPASGKVGVNN